MNGFLIDLHCHTREHSFDGQVAGFTIIQRLRSLGFDGVVFTDHNNVWSDEELAALREVCELPDEFVLLSGQEVHTGREGMSIGDMLVYGPKESIPEYTEPREVIRMAKEAGGFCIAPHPGARSVGLGESLGDFPVLAAEVWNGRYGARVAVESVRLAEKYDIPAIGGSDTHKPGDIGGGGTIFPELPTSFQHIQQMIHARTIKPWRPGPIARAGRWFDDLRSKNDTEAE